ncbi:MAG: S8 family serine peptidase [Ruminobacter sp.]|nr:S8 family serine peptidase [Ruminobacter sp.]
MEVKERGGSLPSHGTQVSGIIAANHNDIGLTGIAYDAKLISMSESIVPQDGKSTDLLKFVADIVEENPQIKVLNASISTDILMQGDDKTKPFEKIYLNNTSLTHSLGNELKPQKFMNYLL